MALHSDEYGSPWSVVDIGDGLAGVVPYATRRDEFVAGCRVVAGLQSYFASLTGQQAPGTSFARAFGEHLSRNGVNVVGYEGKF